MGQRVRDLILQRPAFVFVGFVALHVLLWVLIPALVDVNAPPDVVEGHAWGHEWPLGTYKHPPLQAWILEGAAVLTGHWARVHLLLTQLAVAVTFWAVWSTGRRIVGEIPALLSVLVLDGLTYYTIDTPQYNPLNPNVVQMMFCALMIRYLYVALQDNRTRDWLILGLVSAGGLYGKYSTALLLAVFVAWAIFRPEGRARLREKGPYLAAGLCLVLFIPHLVWLVEHQFLPFAYTSDRLQDRTAFPSFLTAPLEFAVGEVGKLLPVLALFSVAAFRGPRSPRPEVPPSVSTEDKAFFDYVVLGPPLILAVLSSLGGFTVHHLWTTALWSYLGLWGALRWPLKTDASCLKIFASIWGGIFLLGLGGYAVSEVGAPYLNDRPRRVLFPGAEMSDVLEKAWHDHEGPSPLPYVIGTTWLAGNVSLYGADHPRVFIDADEAKTPTITTQDVLAKGGMVIWCVANCFDRADITLTAEGVAQRFPRAIQQEPLTLRWATSAPLPPAVLGWALLPSQKEPTPLHVQETR